MVWIKFAQSHDKVETFIPTAAVAEEYLAIGATGNPITVRGTRAVGIAVEPHTATDVTNKVALGVCTKGLCALKCDAQVNVGNRLTADANARGSVANEGIGEVVSFVVRVANAGADTHALVAIVDS
ncbi:MAG: hypothetical protein ACXW5J_26720 [Thermoanaerobaculia bacterium]